MTGSYPWEAILEVSEGPLAGSVFPIGEGQTAIGREPDNDIVLADSGVSRRHCRLVCEGESVALEDLKSRNSILVNDRKVERQQLSDGDRIRIGKSVMIFRIRRPALADTLADTAFELSSNSTARFRTREGAVLAAVGAAIREMPDEEALRYELLRLIIEISGATRAALVLNGDSPESETVVCLDRERGKLEDPSLSETIIRKVMSSGAPVLSNGIQEPWLQTADSLIVRRVRSVLGVPIASLQRMFGVVYLESVDPHSHFDQNLLDLIAAIAGVAGLSLQPGSSSGGEFLAPFLPEKIPVVHGMVGQSQAIGQVIEAIGRAARTDATVLITGESGTGKELVAKAMHRNSRRATRPFIAINCAAIPENLLESELFGHEKGAFTGALAQKLGKLELANGGTIFLDEVGEMAPMLQSKLLRVLQERVMERVGGSKPIHLDIRVIAATNRDLRPDSAGSGFRADLYYRLNVVALHVPALRDRREDIPLLACHFAQRFATEMNRPVRGVSKAAMAVLMRHDWPGNVRELENAIERAVVMGSTAEILPQDLPESVLQPVSASEETGGRLAAALRDAKRRIVERALVEADGNQTQAAALLGVHPNHLSRLLRTLNMKKRRSKF